MADAMKAAKAGAGGTAASPPKKALNTTNFMRQFRDSESRELKQLTAQQFMDVWEHYDDDGKWGEAGEHLRAISSWNLQKWTCRHVMTISPLI
jgi:hypothetical protein